MSECAETIFNSLLSSVVHRYPLSILTNEHYNKLLQLDKSIYISLPVDISNKGIQINNEIRLNESELEAYKKSAGIIRNASID